MPTLHPPVLRPPHMSPFFLEEVCTCRLFDGADCLQMAIVAIADLRSGDEVLSNYLPSADLPLKERQQRLKECYEFQCHCTLCSTQSAKR